MKKIKVLDSKRLYVKKTRNGSGLFVSWQVEKGKLILKVLGTPFSVKDEKKFNEKIIANSFRFDEKTYINPSDEPADFINHSCSPNCSIVKIDNKLYLLSLRKILPDSEILIDYSTIMAKDDNWKMKCNCGSKNCRIIISKFDTLPPKLQKKYLEIGIVPRHIINVN